MVYQRNGFLAQVQGEEDKHYVIKGPKEGPKRGFSELVYNLYVLASRFAGDKALTYGTHRTRIKAEAESLRQQSGVIRVPEIYDHLKPGLGLNGDHIVMERIGGPTLAEAFPELGESERLMHLTDSAASLAKLHCEGQSHRDYSLWNKMLNPDDLVSIDPGMRENKGVPLEYHQERDLALFLLSVYRESLKVNVQVPLEEILGAYATSPERVGIVRSLVDNGLGKYVLPNLCRFSSDESIQELPLPNPRVFFEMRDGYRAALLPQIRAWLAKTDTYMSAPLKARTEATIEKLRNEGIYGHKLSHSYDAAKGVLSFHKTSSVAKHFDTDSLDEFFANGNIRVSQFNDLGNTTKKAKVAPFNRMLFNRVLMELAKKTPFPKTKNYLYKAMGVAIPEPSKVIVAPNVDIDYINPELLHMGAGVFVGEGAQIWTHYFGRGDKFVIGPVVIGEDTLVGARSIIWPGTKIGRDVQIGSNAVVRGNVPDGTLIDPCEYYNELRKTQVKIPIQ